jgi:hypothetical protein
MVDTQYNRSACPVSEAGRRRRIREDEFAQMEEDDKTASSWGTTPEPGVSHSGQGLERMDNFSASGRGRGFPLTFPFIDQAITLSIPKTDFGRVAHNCPLAIVGSPVSLEIETPITQTCEPRPFATGRSVRKP